MTLTGPIFRLCSLRYCRRFCSCGSIRTQQGSTCFTIRRQTIQRQSLTSNKTPQIAAGSGIWSGPGVGGSSPLSPTNLYLFDRPMLPRPETLKNRTKIRALIAAIVFARASRRNSSICFLSPTARPALASLRTFLYFYESKDSESLRNMEAVAHRRLPGDLMTSGGWTLTAE